LCFENLQKKIPPQIFFCAWGNQPLKKPKIKKKYLWNKTKKIGEIFSLNFAIHKELTQSRFVFGLHSGNMDGFF
jgi:hypothetical protein